MKVKRGFIIGALHFNPLPSFEGFTNLNDILKKARKDLRAFEKGGVDAIIVENNYDLPHKIKVGHETVAAMTYLTKKLMEESKLPFGVSVLWNDFEAALSIAKVCEAKFVRVPVFVDSVETSFGRINANPKEVVEYRKRIDANEILIFTDIHVKHATMLEEKTIKQSVEEALSAGSDGIIITGKWTGNAPNFDDLKEAKMFSKKLPVIVGSGANKENVKSLLEFAEVIIVSTALKEGENRATERNVKPYNYVIDVKKVMEFIKEARVK